MIIDNAGTYTLRYTATDECGNSTTVDRELVVKEPAFGVYWDGSESSSMTRIGKSALFADPIAQHSDGNGGWTDGSSPFDNYMPWSGMEIVEDSEAGTLVSIPKFYYKWTHGLGNEGNGLQLEISDSPQEGFFTSPAHADRGDGVGERDVVYVGRYISSPTYKSETGKYPGSHDISTFRTSIHALGTDVWQWDFAMYWTIAMLYIVEFADWNSQACIGYGCGESNSNFPTGKTDGMTYHTGTNVQSLDTYGFVQYRHIENLFAQRATIVDGVRRSTTGIFCVKNPANFSSNGQLVCENPISGTGSIKSFYEPVADGFEYALFPKEGSNDTSYQNYICDSSSIGNPVIVLGSGTAQRNQQQGLFHFYSTSNTNTDFSSRLMKLPSA